MKRKQTLKEAGISRQSLGEISGGGGYVQIKCNACGGTSWTITTNGDTTTMICQSCGETYVYPAHT